jgi:tetratricopeptide (TPR) repeat protein
MNMLKLVCLDWLSQERSKYVWEDCSYSPWDEVIGRMYLLKAHEVIEESHRYADALLDFEQALLLLAKDGARKGYYARALADQALVQCFLAQYNAALSTLDQALALAALDDDDCDLMMNNRCSMLVLAGAFSDALNLLHMRLNQSPNDCSLRFTFATCLLHLERYEDAVAEYECVLKEEKYLYEEKGLKAARCGQQPDWADL